MEVPMSIPNTRVKKKDLLINGIVEEGEDDDDEDGWPTEKCTVLYPWPDTESFLYDAELPRFAPAFAYYPRPLIRSIPGRRASCESRSLLPRNN